MALPMVLPGLVGTAAVAEDTAPRRFMLEDVNGSVVSDETLQGHFALLFFGYTSCPDVCPTSLLTISSVLQSLGPRGDEILTLFISVDPDRDTRQHLADYMQSFDPRIVALRGPKPFVDAVTAVYDVYYKIGAQDPARPGEYEVDHSASIIFQGPDGNVITRFAPGASVADMAARIREAMSKAPR